MNARNKTKIALVKPSDDPLFVWEGWCDGLYGALNELAKDYNVKVFGYSNQSSVIKRDNIEIQVSDNLSSLRYWLKAFSPKIILGWGTSFDDWKEIHGFNSTRILLYAGGTPNKDKAYKLFNAVVVENESDKKYFDTEYFAFGTNTDVFKPMKLPKMIPAFYPAAFARYKRHDLWAKSVPPGSIAVGELQAHEPECYEVVYENNHIGLPMIGMDSMPFLYNQSQAVVLTPEHMGGCQRAALESMACNIPVLVTNDSKAAEFEGIWASPPKIADLSNAYFTMILTFENGDFNLREDYIMGKYDHYTYAKKLKEIIKEVYEKTNN